MRKCSGIEPGTWWPGYSIPPHVPYESFWSWIHKFAYQNQTSTDVIRQLFRAPMLGHRVTTRDLRDPAGWDLNRLQILWQRPAGEGFILDYLGATPPSIWRVMTWEHLRYCPACAEFGYHTPLFQVRGIGQCPIHEIQLDEACPHCHQAIPYQATPNALWTPYGCPTCGHPLWPTMTDVRHPNVDVSLIMDTVWQWLQEARSKLWGIGATPLVRWQSQGSGANGGAEGLVSYWYQVHPPPVLGMVVDCGRTVQVVEWGGEGAANSYAMADGPAARQQALRTLYKAYARHWRRELRHHRSCIRLIVRHVQIVPTSACDWYTTDRVCPWAFAYILWRMYWNTFEEPGQIDRKRIKGRLHQFPQRRTVLADGYWGTQERCSERESASARWLAEHEATLMFSITRSACETLAAVMENAGQMVWDPHLVSDGLPAVSIKEHPSGTVRFYCWPSYGDEPPETQRRKVHRQTTQAQVLHIESVMRARIMAQVERLSLTRNGSRASPKSTHGILPWGLVE